MTERDFSAGVSVADVSTEHPLFGRRGDDALMLIRHSNGDVVAFSATCTHYSGPLAEGAVTEGVVRCPWHHACFSLRTGEALAAPALLPLQRYSVRIADGHAHVGGKHSVVIIGAGAAGSAAAEMLRHEGYGGDITVIDPDADAPYDRPNLSKDFLNGHAPEEWLPLPISAPFTRIVATVTAIDATQQQVTLDDGRTLDYGSLLLATGASPIRPPIPGADHAHVHVLRSLADCRRIIAAVEGRKRVVIAGASFIGMEVAAALRQRDADVTIVAPEAVPFTRVLGDQLGQHLRNIHEKNGVRFELGRTVKEINERAVVLDDDAHLECDVVILGIGVRPLLQLAADAGLDVDKGVLVDEFLHTSAPNIYAAGDIALPRGGYRVEHWVVAQRQGQTAARNILGRPERYDAVPFFWTQQYDVPVAYVGHAADWDATDVDGSIEQNDCTIKYSKNGNVLAVVTIGRDQANLQAEIAMETKA